MADERKIKFGADGSELTAFMKKLQSDSKAMYESFANEAVKQTKNQKEQFKIIEDQLKASREFLKVQKEITQEKIKQAKSVLSNIPEIGYENMAERVAAERKIQRLQNELNGISTEDRNIKGAQDVNKNNKPKEEKEKLTPSIFSEVLKAGLFRDILAMMRQGAGAQNGSDLISPFFSVTGGAAGAGLGYATDLIVKGLTVGQYDPELSAKLGAAGKEFGGLAGDLVTREFKTREQFDVAYNKYRALGGNESAAPMTSMGYSSIDVAERMSAVSQAQGSNAGTGENTSFMLALQRGYGIGEGDALAAFGMQRSGSGNVKQNVQRALGVGIAEGLDRSRFSDAIKTQTALLQKFSETKENVSGADATRLMYEFNKMGGMFSIGDPRLLPTIDKINSGLSSPGTAFGQAQNYSILRSMNSSASMFDLKKMEEQGIQTPGFLQGVLRQIKSSGGSEDFQKFQLKERFGLSYEATDKLYKEYNKEGSVNVDKFVSNNKVKDEAEGLTSRYTKMNAEVVEAFKKDFSEAIGVIAGQFKTEIGRAIVELKDAATPRVDFYMPGDNMRAPKVPQKNGPF